MSSLAHIILLVLQARIVWGQSTNATCQTSFNWMNNSLQQSPCLVAAYLENQCSETAFIVPALPVDTWYTGPAFSSADPCKCSTVTYSLISACGACQGRKWQDWGDWSANCASVELEFFPKDIPSGTNVPLWAYLNVSTTNNTFDVFSAQQNESDTSQSTSSASTPAPSSSTLTTQTFTPQTTSAASSLSTSSKSKTGTIAGGVVGGVVGLVLIANAAFWFFFRRHRLARSREKPVAASGSANLTGGGVPTSPVTAPEMSEYYYNHNTTRSEEMSSLGATSGIYSNYGPMRNSMESLGIHTISTMRPGGNSYSGVPEV